MKRLTCIECGVEFGLGDPLYEQRLADNRDFRCPNGHRQRFVNTDPTSKLLASAQNANQRLERELEEWKQTGRHCPICQQRVSQARSAEVAAHKMSLHLQQVHGARGALLALMPASEA